MKIIVDPWFVDLLEWMWNNRKELQQIAQETNQSEAADSLEDPLRRKLDHHHWRWLGENLDEGLFRKTRKFERFAENVISLGFPVPLIVERDK